MNQTPPAKGKLDVFGAIQQQAASGVWDPITGPSSIHEYVKKNGLEAVFDEQAIRQKLAADPRYSQDPQAIEQDIELVRGIYQDVVSPESRPIRSQDKERLAQAQNARDKRALSIGLPSADYIKGRSSIDSFSFAGTRVLNEQQLAAGIPGKNTGKAEYIDATGERKPLTRSKLFGGDVYADFEVETDRYGRLVSTPVLRELRAGEQTFGKDMVSKLGLRPERRDWISGSLAGAWNGLSDFFAIPLGGIQAMASDPASERLADMQRLYAKMGKPAFVQNWRSYQDNGDMSARADYSRMDYDTIVRASEDDIDDIAKGIKADYKNISDAARSGDPVAKSMIQFVDAYDNTRGKSWTEKWMANVHAIQQAARFSESRRIQEGGALGSMEGLLSAVSYSMAQMAPAMKIGAGVGALTRAVAARNMAGTIGKASSVALNAKWGSAIDKATKAGFYVPMTGVATNQVYNTAREAGLDHDDAILLSAYSAPAILLTEKMISAPWVMRSYMAGGGVRATEEMLAKSLGRDIKAAMKAGEMSSAAKMRNWLQRSGPISAVNGWMRALSKGSEKAWKNRLMNASEGFIREGSQESLEESWYAAMEQVVAPEVFGQGGAGYSDFWSRMSESFIVGGLAGAGIGAISAMRPTPDPVSIHKSVLEGKGDELISIASKMQQEGRITDQELSVIQQAVDVAGSHVVSQLSTDPEYAKYIKGNDDLASEYAKAASDLSVAESGLKSAQQSLASITDEAQKQVAEQTIALEQKKVDAARLSLERITNGTRAAELMADAALRKVHVDYHKGQKGFDRMASVKKLEDLFVKFKSSTSSSDLQKREARSKSVQDLSAAIDQVTGSDLKSSKEAFGLLGTVVASMRQSGTLAGEDVALVSRAIDASRSKLLAELMQIDFPQGIDPNGGTPTLGMAVQASDQLDVLGEEDTAMELIRGAETSSDDLTSGLLSMETATGFLPTYFGDDLQKAATELPPADSFSGSPKSIEARFLSTYVSPDGGWVDAKSLLDQLNRISEISEDDAADAYALLDYLEFAQQMPDLSKAMVNASEGMGKMTLPGFEQFKQVAKDIHGPMSVVSEADRTEARSIRDSIEKRLETLVSEIDRRKLAIKREHRRVIEVDGFLSAMYFGLFTDAVDERTASDIARLNESMSSENEYEIEKALLPIHQKIHLDLSKNPSRFGQFIEHARITLLGDSVKRMSGYSNTKFDPEPPSLSLFAELTGSYRDENGIVRTDPTKAVNRNLFGINTSRGLNVLVGVSSTIANWTASMVFNPADFYRSYEPSVSVEGQKMPHALQRRSIRELVTFSMLSSAQRKALFYAGVDGAEEDGNNLIPRSSSYLGKAGTGKTTTIPVAISALENSLGRSLKIGVSAPGAPNANDLKSALSIEGRPPVVVFDESITSGETDLSGIDVLVVDEAHFITEEETSSWRMLMERNPHILQVIFVGDTNQTTATSGHIPVPFPIAGLTPSTTHLEVSIRSGNSELVHVQDSVSRRLRAMEILGSAAHGLSSTKYTSNGTGVRFLPSSQSVVDLFVQEIQSIGSSGRVLIVIDDTRRTEVIQQISSKLIGASEYDKLIAHLKSNVKTMSRGENSAMGREYPFAYVAIDQSELKNRGYDNPEKAFPRYFYTSITRAQSGLVASLPSAPPYRLSQSINNKAPDPKTFSLIHASETDLLSSANAALMASRSKKPSADPSVVQEAPTKSVETDQRIGIPEGMMMANPIGLNYLKKMGIQDPEKPFTIVAASRNESGQVIYRAERPSDGAVFDIPASFVVKSTYSEPPTEEEVDPEGDRDVPKIIPTSKSKHPIGSGLAYLADTDIVQTQFGQDPNPDVESNPYAAVRKLLIDQIAQNPGHYTVRLNRSRTPFAFANNPSFATEPTDIVSGHLNEVGPILTALKKLGNKLPANIKSALDASNWNPDWQTLYNLGLTAILTIPKDNRLNTSDPATAFYGRLWSDTVDENGFLQNFRSIPLSGVSMPIKFEGPGEYGRGDVSLSKLLRWAKILGWQTSGPLFEPSSEFLNYSKASIAITPFGSETIWINIRAPKASKADLEQIFSEKYAVDGSIDKFLQANNKRISILLKNSPLGDHLRIGIRMARGKSLKVVLPKKKSKQAMKDLLGVILADPNLFELQKNLSITDTKSFRLTDESIDEAMTSIIRPDIVFKSGFSVENLPMPNIKMTIPGAAVEGESASDKGIDSESPLGDVLFSSGSIDPVLAPYMYDHAQEMASEYLRKVLGDRFINKNLEFKPAFDGVHIDRAVYGKVEGALMTLYTDQGKVRTGVERHEAIHYVVRNLLDEASESALLSEAKRELSRGIPSSNPNDFTDRQAHEYIADRFESESREATSLIGRFVSWLKNVLRRWGLYRMTISDLYTAVDSGVYRNSKPTRETEYSDALFSEVSASDSEVDPLNESDRNLIRRSGSKSLLRILGGSQNVLIQLQRRWTRAIIEDTGLANIAIGTDVETPLNFSESISRWYGQLLEQVKRSPKEFSFLDGSPAIAFDEVSSELLMLGTSESKNNFVRHQLAKPEVFKLFVKTILPNHRISQATIQAQLDLFEEQEAGVIDADEYLERVGRIHGTAHNSNDQYSLSDRSTWLVKMLLTNMNAIEERMIDGKPAFVETLSVLPIRLVNEVLALAANESTPQDDVDFALSLGDSLQAIARRGGKLKTAATTIYHRFFSPSIGFSRLNDKPGKSRMSYYAATFSADPVVMEAARMQKLAFAQIVSLFRSSSSWNLSFDREDQLTGSISTVRVLSHPDERIKQEVASGLISLYTRSGRTWHPSPEAMSKISVNDSGTDVQASTLIKIREQGILLSDDSVLVSFTDGIKFGKRGDRNVGAEEISIFFEAIGLEVSPEAIYEAISGPDSRNRKEDLLRIMSGFAKTIHSSWSQLLNPDSDLRLWSLSYSTDYRGRKEQSRLSIDSLAGLVPPNLGTEMRKMAEIISAQGSWSSSTVRNFKGSTDNLSVIGSLKRRTLRPASSGKTSGDLWLDVVKRISKDPFVTMTHNGRILGESAISLVDNFFDHEGLDSGTIRSGYKDISSVDHEVLALDAFLTSAEKSAGILRVRLGIFGDREKMPAIDVVLPAYFNVETYQNDPNKIIDMIKDVALYYKEQHLASMERWSEAGLDPYGQHSYNSIRDKGLIENMDYIKKGESIKPGRAITMDHPIYNSAGVEQILAGDLSKLNERAKLYAELFNGFGVKYAKSAVAYWFLHHIYDHWARVTTSGSPWLHKDFRTSVKRGATAESPSQIGYFSPQESFVSVSVIDPSLIPNAPKGVLDGQKFVLPWMQLLNEDAYGGLDGVYKRGVNKMIYASPVLIDKSAELTITPEMYVQNEFYRSLILDSLSKSGLNEFAQRWKSELSDPTIRADRFAKKYWALSREIAEASRQRLSSVIGFVTSKDNIKQGYSGEIMMIDRRNYGFQTDLSRDISELSTVSQASQITSFMGLHPSNEEAVRAVEEAQATYSKLLGEEIKKEISSMSGSDLAAKTRNYVVSLMNASSGSVSEVGQLILATSKENASPNDPLLIHKVLQTVNKFLFNGVNPRISGAQYSAVSAHGFTNPTTNAPLLPPRAENGEYRPGEVIMPFNALSVFGNAVKPWMNIDEMRLSIQEKLGLDAVAAFEDILTVYVSRTPASMLASGHWFKVVGFVQDAGNVVFTPAEFNGYTGGDFDGDQLSVFSRPYESSFSEDGRFTIQRKTSGSSGYQNAWMDGLWKIYNNSASFDEIFSQVGTDEIAALSDSVTTTEQAVPQFASDAYSNAMIRQEVIDGSSLIGMIASNLTSYSYMTLAMNRILAKEGEDGINRVFRRSEKYGEAMVPALKQSGDGSRLVIANMSQALNAALDNIKLLALGRLGVSPMTIGVFMGSIMRGSSLQDAVKLVNSPAVVAAAQMSKPSLGRRSGSLYNVMFKNMLLIGLEGYEEAIKSLAFERAASRFNTVVRLKSKSLKSDPGEFRRLMNNIQFNLAVPAELLSKEEPLQSNLDFARTIKPWEFASKKARGRELFVRQIDLASLVNELPGVSAVIRVVVDMGSMLERSHLFHSEQVKALEKKTASYTGRSAPFDKDGAIRFEQAVLERVITSYYAQAGIPAFSLINSAKINLASVHGLYRLSKEFPRYHKLVHSRVMALPMEDPRRKAYIENSFLKRLSVIDSDGLKLRMDIPAARIDALEEATMINDSALVDQIITNDLVPEINGIGYQKMITHYAAASERLVRGRSNVSSFIDPSTTSDLSAFIDKFSIPEDDFDGFVRQFYFANPALLPQMDLQDLAGDEAEERSLIYFRSNGLIWSSSPLAPIKGSMSSFSASISKEIDDQAIQIVPELDDFTYDNVLSGKSSDPIKFSGNHGLVAGKAILPTGQTAIIETPSDRIIRIQRVHPITQEAPGDHSATIHELRLVPQVGLQRTYGKGNADLNGKSVKEVLSMIANRSTDKSASELASWLLDQNALFERKTSILVAPLSEGGRLTKLGTYNAALREITIDSAIGGHQVERVLLHEMLHRFTANVVNSFPEQRTTEEQVFVDRITSLYEKAKAAGISDYGMENVGEFIAEAFTSPSFQAKLRSIDGEKAKKTLLQSLWDSIIELINWLAGSRPIATSLLMDVLDTSKSYIEYASRSGRDLDASGFFNKINAASTTVSGQFSSSRELIDWLSGSPNSIESEKERDIRFRVSSFVARYKAGQRTFVNPYNKQRETFEDIPIEEFARQVRERYVQEEDSSSLRVKEYTISALNESQGRPDVAKQLLVDRVNEDEDRSFGIDMADRLIDLAGVNEGHAFYLRYSDIPSTNLIQLGSRSISTTEIGLSAGYFKEMTGYDPIVRIYANDLGGVEISMFDVSSESLAKKKDPDSYDHFFDRALSSAVQRLSHAPSHGNSNATARGMAMTMAAMAMKQVSSGMKIRSISTIGPDGVSGVWLRDYLMDIKEGMSSPGLKKALSGRLLSVLSDSSLYDHEAYQQSSLAHYAQYLSERPNETDGSTVVFEAIKKYTEGIPSVDHNAWQILSDRMNYLINRYTKGGMIDTVSFNRDEEVKLLSQALLEIGGKSIGESGSINSTRDTSGFGLYLKTSMNQDHSVFQLVRSMVRSTGDRVAKRHLEFIREHSKRLEAITTYDQIVSGKVVGNAFSRFEHLYRKSVGEGEKGIVVLDKSTGKPVKGLRLSMIHWNENDPETAQLLSEGKLTQAHLDYANWVLDVIRDQYIENVIVKMKLDGEFMENGKFNEEKASSQAAALVDSRLKRGFIPPNRAKASELLAEGRFSKALSNTFLRSSDIDSFYVESESIDEMMSRDVSRYGMIQNRYNRYISEMPANSIGADNSVLPYLGIESDIFGNLYAIDQERNELTGMDVELMVNQFMHSSLRVNAHNLNSVPVYHSARAVLNLIENQTGRDQANTMKLLDDWSRRQLFAVSGIQERAAIAGKVGIQTLANSSISATTYAAMFLNPWVALASAAMNSFSGLSTAVTNGLVGDGFFGAKDLSKAVGVCFTPEGNKKMRALMIEHFVFEMNERDVSNPSIHGSAAQKRLVSSYSVNVLNRMTDYTARGVVMAAQMMKDGSWDAYSLDKDGNVVYDETKDRRFYADGKLTESGAVLKKKIREVLIEEGIHTAKQADSDKLVVGYTLKQGRKFKAISDKWVMGSMDSEQQAVLYSFTLGRVLGQFRRYLPDKIVNWYSRTTQVEDLGDFSITQGPNGEKIAKWQALEVKSVFGAVRELINLFSVHGTKSLAELQELPASTKRALYKGAIDLTLFGFIWAVSVAVKNALGDDDDDRKKTKISKINERYMMILDSLGWDQVGGSPAALVKMYAGSSGASVAPSVTWVWRLMNTVKDPSKIDKVLPGSQVVDLVEASFEDESTQ